MSDSPAGSDLIRSVLGGFSWNVAGSSARAISAFLINIALARLLGPEPFGIVTLAMVVIGLGNIVIESGLGSALVQKQELTAVDVSYVFTLQMMMGLGLALLVAASAPLLASLFSNASVASVLRVLSLVLVIQAFSQVPSALLRRSMNFKRLQQAQVISYLAGYLALGLPLAFAGFGVWSLVAAQLAQVLVNAIIVYWSAPHSLGMTLKGSSALARFGLRVLGSNIAYWIVPNAQNTVIGWRFGAADLGYYGRSYNLSLTPLGIILNSAQSVLFSAISKVGKSTQTLRIFTSFMSAFSVILAPIYVIMAVGSRDIITFFYGTAWLPSADLLGPLSLAMLILALTGLEGPALTGLGLPHYQLQIEWITTVFSVIALLLASQVSLTATAWSVVLVYLLRFVLMTHRTLTVLQMPWHQFFRPVLSGLALALVASLGWKLGGNWLAGDAALWTRLLSQGLSAGAAWLVALVLGRRCFFPEMEAGYHYLLALRKAH